GQGLKQNGQQLSCFTTGAGTQTGVVQVVGVSPVDQATGVPLNAAVQVQGRAPGSTGRGGSGAVGGAGNGQAVAGTVTASGTVLTFTPGSVLAASTAYTVTVPAGGFTDLAGNGAQSFSSSFTTSTSTQTTGPQVLSVQPLNGTTGVATNSNVV